MEAKKEPTEAEILAMKQLKLEQLQRKRDLYNVSLNIIQIILGTLILAIPIIIYLTSEGAQKFLKKSSGVISGVQLKKVNVLTNKDSLYGRLVSIFSKDKSLKNSVIENNLA